MTSYLQRKGLIGAMVIAIGASTVGGSVSQVKAATAFFYKVEDLGTLGGSNSYAFNINSAGQVIGWSETSNGETHAVLWDKGNKIDLGTLGSSTSYAYGINNAGQVVGASCNSYGANCRAVLWDKGNKIDLGTLGGSYGSADSINDAGQVVGYAATSNDKAIHAILWDKGNKIDLDKDAYDVHNSNAFAINNAGQVVGKSDPGFHAVLWDKDKKIDLETVSTSAGFSINNAGKVVGYRSDLQPALWDKGNKIKLDTLNGYSYGSAYSINNAGKVVGKVYNLGSTSTDTERAVLWDKGSIKDLNNLIRPRSGWHLSAAAKINDRGQIVGAGTINGHTHAFLLTPVRVTQ